MNQPPEVPTERAHELSGEPPSHGGAEPDDTVIESSEPSLEETQEAPVSAQSQLFEKGRRLGRYFLLEELGQGGMGVVHAAFDQELGRKIAIKLVRQAFRSAMDQDQERLQQEAKAMAMVTHPNIVTVFDVGRSEDDVFIAMEYVPGWTLREWRKQERRWWRVLRIFMEAGEGLAAAHAHGLIHRDFKPDNVLVGRDGRVKVADFGLARLDRQESSALGRQLEEDPKAPPGRLGTPAYMSPEQHRGRPAGPASDQFSFCVSLWESLFGQHPFSARDGSSLAVAVTRGYRSASPRGSGVPPAIIEVLERGLDLMPEHRHPSMRVLLDQLRGALDAHFGSALAVPTSAEARVAERHVLGARYRRLPESDRFGLDAAFDQVKRRLVAIYCPMDSAEEGRSLQASDAVSLYRIISQLDHPHLVGLGDLGFDDARGPFLVYDLPSDAELLLAAKKTASFDAQLGYLVDLLRLIGFLHDAGLSDLAISADCTFVVGGRVKLLLKAPPKKISDGPQDSRSARRARTRDMSRFAKMAHAVLLDDADSQADTLSWSDTDLDPDLARLFRELVAGNTLDADARNLATRLALVSGRRTDFETPETREAQLRSVSVVGRGDELDRLLDGLRAAVDGKGSLKTLIAESGCGKSRLLDLLEANAVGSGNLVLRGQCESDAAAAYQALRDPLRLLSLHTAPTPFEASVLSWVVPDLDSLLESDVHRAPELDAESMQRRLCDVIESLLLRSTRPSLILIEDVQWARPETLSLLLRLKSRVVNLRAMLCLTLRSDFESELPPALLSDSRVRLEPFSLGQVETLVRRLPIRQEDATNIAAYVFRHSEGNPLFAIEVLRSLAEQSGSLAEIRADRLPALLRVGGLMRGLRKRLLKLPEETWPLLRLAAVAGRRIDLAFLQRLEGADKVGTFAEAARSAAIVDERSGDLRFSHDKIREAVLEETTAQQKQRLHRQLGQALEEEAKETGGGPRLLRLAYHFAEAGDPEREARYSGAAGLELVHSSPGEATRLLHRAVELAPRYAHSHLETWRRALAEAEFDLGRLERAATQLEVACQGLQRPLPRTRFGWRARLVREVCVQGLHLLLPARLFRERSPSTSVELALALDKLVEVYSFQGRRLETMTSCLMAINVGDRAGVLPLGSLGILGYTASLLGLRRVASLYFRRGRQLIDESTGAFHPFFFLTEAFADFAVGQLQLCRERLLQGFELGKQLGHTLGAFQCISALGLVEWSAGRFENMLTHYEMILDQKDFVAEHDTANLSAVATSLALLGRQEEARLQLERVAETVEKTPGTMRMAINSGRAYTLALCNQLEDACELADLSMHGVAPESLESVLLISLWGPLEAYLPAWESAQKHDQAQAAVLREKAKRQVRLLARFARMVPIARGFAQLARARFLRVDGRQKGALRAARKSLKLVRARGQTYAEALTQRELSRLLTVGTLEQSKAQTGAEELLERCGVVVSPDRPQVHPSRAAP